jgi:hypothetical protein
MSSTTANPLDTGDISPADVDAWALGLDRARRRHEASLGWFVGDIETSGLYRRDGHRSITAWGRSACNWSTGEAIRFGKLGRALHRLPRFAEAALAGHIGVASMHEFAALVANPRVQHALDASEALLVQHACTLEFDDFVTAARRWESLADPDGSHRSHEDVHRRRRAHLSAVGNEFVLDATCGVAQGALMREVFERFQQAEWRAEWDRGLADHGAAMHAGLLERTSLQRNLDALVAVFRAAAGSGEAGGEIVVNVLVDQATFEHDLTKALGGTPAPLDPRTVGQRRSETSRGDLLDPADVIVAACLGHVRRVVLDSAGVIIDLGRRTRLFTGPLRDAVLLTERRCLWPGCSRPASQCEADHLLPFAHAGPTSAANGGPMCGHHNRWKNQGYRTWRDQQGRWHVYRPNGTGIGWAIEHVLAAA